MYQEKILTSLITFINKLELPSLESLQHSDELLDKFHANILSLHHHIQAFYRSIVENHSSSFHLEIQIDKLTFDIMELIGQVPSTENDIVYPDDEERKLCAINFKNIILNSPLENLNNNEFTMNSADDITKKTKEIVLKTLTGSICQSNVHEKLHTLNSLLECLSEQAKIDFEKIHNCFFDELKKSHELGISKEEEEIKNRFYSSENPFFIDFQGAFGQQFANFMMTFGECFNEKKRFFENQALKPFDEIKFINAHGFVYDNEFEINEKLEILGFEDSFSRAISLDNLIVRLDKKMHQDFIKNIKKELNDLVLNYRNKISPILKEEHPKIKSFKLLLDMGVDVDADLNKSIINESDEEIKAYLSELDKKIAYYEKQIILSLYAYEIQTCININERNYQSSSPLHCTDRYRDDAFLSKIKEKFDKLKNESSTRCLTKRVLNYQEIKKTLDDLNEKLVFIDNKINKNNLFTYFIPANLSKTIPTVKSNLNYIHKALARIANMLSDIKPKEQVLSNNNNLGAF